MQAGDLSRSMSLTHGYDHCAAGNAGGPRPTQCYCRTRKKMATAAMIAKNTAAFIALLTTP